MRAAEMAFFTLLAVAPAISAGATGAPATAGPRQTLLTCYPFDAVRPGGPLRWVVIALPATS